jgi:anti-sigma B factor antagonist
MDENWTCCIEEQGNITVFRMAGELDIATAPEVRQVFDGWLASVNPAESGNVLLDFSALEFIDSTGLGVMVAFRKRLRDHTLDIVGASPHIQRIFSITGLAKIFGFYANREEAIAAHG